MKQELKIFISYARADSQSLAYQLKEDLRNAGHDPWLDVVNIRAGTNWLQAIEDAISGCDVVLAILSPAALASPYCQGEQLRALNKKKYLIPLLAFSDVDLPIYLATRNYLDFTDPQEYETTFQLLIKALTNKDTEEWEPKSVERKLEVDALDDDYVLRQEELTALKRLLLRNTSDQRIGRTAVQGMGGTGKSILVQALCHDPSIKEHFSHGIIWIEIGNDQQDMLGKLKYAGMLLGDSFSYYSSLDLAKYRLQQQLRTKSLLIVLDDVWRPEQITPFLVDAPKSHLVFTTRDQSLAAIFQAEQYDVGKMTPEQSVELLRNRAQHDDPVFSEIAERLAHLPLALKLAGAKIRDEDMTGQRWLDTFKAISQLRIGRSEDRYYNLLSCFKVSVDDLGEENARLYYTLGIFPEDVWIPKNVVSKLWHQIRKDIDDSELLRLVENLKILALIEIDKTGETIRLHDLLHSFNREMLKKNHIYLEAQIALLNAYKQPQIAWHKIREHDDYLYFYLPHHMIEANRKTELYDILETAPTWLSTQFRTEEKDSAISLEHLVVQIWKLYTSDPEIETNTARNLLINWLQSKHATLASKSIALRCAYVAADDEALITALGNQDKQVKEMAIRYGYLRYQNRKNSQVIDSLFHPLMRNITYFGIPRINRIQTLSKLLLLCLVYSFRHEKAGTPERRQMLLIAKQTIRDTLVMDNLILGPFSWFARRYLLGTGLKLIESLMDDGKSRDKPIDNTANLNELKPFFRNVSRNDSPVRQLLPYLNRSKKDLAAKPDVLLAMFDPKNYPRDEYNAYVRYINALVVTVQGAPDPDRVVPVIQAMVNHQELDPDYLVIGALDAWRWIMELQVDVKERWVLIARNLCEKYYQKRKRDYGLAPSSNNRIYESYPIVLYTSIANKYEPDNSGDLVEKYLQQAEQMPNGPDLALIRHIIKGFGDLRTPLENYRPLLRHISSYLSYSDGNIRKLAVQTLGIIHSRYAEDVDDHLKTLNIQERVIAQIHQQSYSQSSSEIFLSSGGAVILLLSSMAPDEVDWFINMIEEAFDTGNFSSGLKSIFANLLKLV